MTHPSQGYLLWTLAIMACALGVVKGSTHPSSRTLYYLHTTPATWRSARDTCAGYGAHLIHNKDSTMLAAEVSVLDDYLTWYQAFSTLNQRVWSGLYHNEANIRLYWDTCQEYDKTRVSHDVLVTGRDLTSDNLSCAAIDPDHFTTSAHVCDQLLPYICQIEQGECWFLPVDNKALIDPTPKTHYNLDVQKCAQNCRETDVDANGSECWGFTYTALGACQLYMTATRHAPLQDFNASLEDSPGDTAYIKICIGGSVTNMAPVVVETGTDETCSGMTSSGDVWHDGLCFCECELPPSFLEPSELILTLSEQVRAIIKRLSLDPTNTSLAYRKLNCAQDDRTSASSIGSVGVAFTALLIGAVVILDVGTLLTHLTTCLARRPDKLVTSPPTNVKP